MPSNANYDEADVFPSTWDRKRSMEMFDRLSRAFREAIAYADADYSIEELYTAPEVRGMTSDKLLAFLWEHSDGFEIRYPYHVRVQYERARAASYRNHYVSDWDPWRNGMEVFNGCDPGWPLR